MLHENFRLINEEFVARRVLPEQMDELWEIGWRHFGTHFFRYNVGLLHFDIMFVLPLRIRLSDFSLSKSQRRVLRKNADLEVRITPATLTEEDHVLFDRHKMRFDHSVPDSLFDFLSDEPASSPCEAKEIRVFDKDRLLAVSYFDVGAEATSGLYAMFEPTEASRALGIFTMLKEIQWSIAAGHKFYYQGYAYAANSFYDYKKRFRGTEAFDWNGNWRRSEPSRPD